MKKMKLILFIIFKEMICTYKYLGVERYGEIERNEVLNQESQIYRFLSNNEEKKFKIYHGDKINTTDTGPDYNVYKCEDGAFPVQNKLIEGYEYELTFENDYIKDIKQITHISNTYIPPISYIPGLKTLKNFISTAFQPIGTTLYVFGGGWDFQDIGSSNEGRTIGISLNWVKFFDDQNSNYTYRDDNNKNVSYYPFNGYNQYYYAGLDCSGFVGWVIYNNLYKDSLTEKGFIMSSKNIAKSLKDKNYGIWMHTVEGSTFSNPNYTLLAQELKVGDILSTNGHVMIYLGKCNDGSFVIMHSTPSKSITGYPGGGVQLSAVNIKEDGSKNCEAYSLCEEYMKKYFKKWSQRYNVIVVSASTVFNFDDKAPNTGLFHWDLENGIITDPEKYSSKSAKEILTDLFQENNNNTVPSEDNNNTVPFENNTSSGDSTFTIIIIIIIVLVVSLLIIAFIFFIMPKMKDRNQKENNNMEIEGSPLMDK